MRRQLSLEQCRLCFCTHNLVLQLVQLLLLLLQVVLVLAQGPSLHCLDLPGSVLVLRGL